MPQKFKILSLDGGGVWSILQTLTLNHLYPNLSGHEILKEFDLVIANSGGSIVLASLVENLTFEEAQATFNKQENREKIFSKNTVFEKYFPIGIMQLFGLPFGPKYSAPKKKAAFDQLFPDFGSKHLSELPKLIGDASPEFVVCTFNAYDNRAKFFRSYSDNPELEDVTLNEVIHGSSNAPIQYFDFPARFKSSSKQPHLEKYYELWDGALGGFNNPVVAGIIEAYKLGYNNDQIQVLSIGTGNKVTSEKEKEDFYKYRFSTQKNRNKKLNFKAYCDQWAFFKLSVLQQAKTILYEPPDWANFVAFMMLSGNNKEKAIDFIRLSPMIFFNEDTSTSNRKLLETLYNLDMDLTDACDVQLLYEFFERWRDDEIINQPLKYKITRDNQFITEVGNTCFSEEVARYKNLNK